MAITRLLLTTLVVAFAVSGTAFAGSSADHAKTTDLGVTLNAGVTSSGSGTHFTSWNFQGSTVVPGLGAVSYTGTYGVDTYTVFVGVDENGDFIPVVHESRVLSVTFVAANGDSLSVGGLTDWLQADPAPQLTWAATGTGRFADYTGNGTFTVVSPDESSDPAHISVSFAGTLVRTN
jgi:hypothetical protein